MAKVSKSPFIECYKSIRELNQFMKNLTPVYIVDEGGMVFMPRDTELSVERVAILNSNFIQKIYPYMDKMMNAQEFFAFARDSKVAEVMAEVGPNPYSEEHMIHHLVNHEKDLDYPMIPYKETSAPYSLKDILGLKHYHTLFHPPFDNIMKDIIDFQSSEKDLTNEDGRVADQLADNQAVEMSLEGFPITLVKALFPNIKKALALDARVIMSEDIRVYVLYKETYDFITVYTLTAYLSVDA